MDDEDAAATGHGNGSGRAAVQWAVIGPLLLGTLLTSFDNNMVLVTYPTLTADFRAPVADVAWVGVGYLLARTALLAVFGRLADMRGRRRIYRTGFVVIAIGSALAVAAPVLWALVLCRVVTATGAAMVTAAGTALLAESVPRRRLAGAVGVVGTTVSVAVLSGPLVAGFVLQAAGWRPVFGLDIPLALTALVWASRRFPGETPTGPAEPFDGWGAATLAGGLVGLLLAASLGPRDGFAGGTLLLLAAGCGSLGAFVAIERRTPRPLVDLGLFASRVFSAATSSKVFAYAAGSAGSFLMPFYLERLLGFTPAEVGLAVAPMPLAMAAGTLLGGQISDRVGSRGVSPTALLIAAAGAAGLAVARPAGGYASLLAGMVVWQFGLGGFYSSNDSAILKSAPPGKTGIASGVLAMARTAGLVTGLTGAAAAFPASQTAAARPEVVLATFHHVSTAIVLLCLVGAGLSLLRIGAARGPRRGQAAG